MLWREKEQDIVGAQLLSIMEFPNSYIEKAKLARNNIKQWIKSDLVVASEIDFWHDLIFSASVQTKERRRCNLKVFFVRRESVRPSVSLSVCLF